MADRKEKAIKLSIITVNYKTDDLVMDLLQKLTPRSGVEIIIVDNSPEETLRSKLPKRKHLKYIFAGKNLGFSGGNNLGLAQARGEWVFLLNSDTLVTTQDILDLIIDTKKHKYLVSAPRLIQLDGKIQNNVGHFDTFFQNVVNYIFARPRFLDCSEISALQEVDLLTGAAMLIHRSVFDRIGSLDDRNFFMYFEDIDFSYRLYQAKIKILYHPDIRIVHFGGASSDQDKRQKNQNYQHGLSTYLRKHRGQLIFWLNRIFHALT